MNKIASAKYHGGFKIEVKKVNDNWLTKPLLSHNHLREGAGLKGGHQRKTWTTDAGEVFDSYYDQIVSLT